MAEVPAEGKTGYQSKLYGKFKTENCHTVKTELVWHWRNSKHGVEKKPHHVISAFSFRNQFLFKCNWSLILTKITLAAERRAFSPIWCNSRSAFQWVSGKMPVMVVRVMAPWEHLKKLEEQLTKPIWSRIPVDDSEPTVCRYCWFSSVLVGYSRKLFTNKPFEFYIYENVLLKR